MTPAFEMLQQEMLETQPTADTVVAANILDKFQTEILGKQQELPGSHAVFEKNPLFNEQSILKNEATDGIPANHDCTRCIVNAASCTLLQAAETSSPFKNRLNAVSELTAEIPDFMQLPKDQTDALIKERINIIKSRNQVLAETSTPADPLQTEGITVPTTNVAVIQAERKIPDHILKMRQKIQPKKAIKPDEDPREIVKPDPDLPVEKKEVQIDSLQPQVTKVPEQSAEPKPTIEVNINPEPVVTQTINEVLQVRKNPKAIIEPVGPVQRKEIFTTKTDSPNIKADIVETPVTPAPINSPQPVSTERVTKTSTPKQDDNKNVSETIEVQTESKGNNNLESDKPGETQEMENIIFVDNAKPTLQPENTDVPSSVESTDEIKIDHTFATEDLKQNVFTFEEETTSLEKPDNSDTSPELFEQIEAIDFIVDNTSEEIHEDITATQVETQPDIFVETTAEIFAEESQDEFIFENENTETIQLSESNPQQNNNTEEIQPKIELEIAIEKINYIPKKTEVVTRNKEKIVAKSLEEIKQFLTELPNIEKNKKQNKWIEILQTNPPLAELKKTLEDIWAQLFLINHPEILKDMEFEKAASNNSLLYKYLSQKAAKEEMKKYTNQSKTQPLTYSQLLIFLWSYSNILTFVPLEKTL